MLLFKVKVNERILIHSIINYKFFGNNFKIPYFIGTTKENWKEDCNSNNTLKFSLMARR